MNYPLPGFKEKYIYLYSHTFDIHKIVEGGAEKEERVDTKREDKKRGEVLSADCSIGIGAPSTLSGEDVQRLCPRARRIRVTGAFPSPIHLSSFLPLIPRAVLFHPCLPSCHLIIFRELPFSSPSFSSSRCASSLSP